MHLIFLKGFSSFFHIVHFAIRSTIKTYLQKQPASAILGMAIQKNVPLCLSGKIHRTLVASSQVPVQVASLPTHSLENITVDFILGNVYRVGKHLF